MTDEPQEQTAETDAPPAEEKPSTDECNLAMLAHLLAIVSGFLAPLIIWLIKKDSSPFVDDQGKEALNFQITLALGYFPVFLLSCITMGFASPLMFVVFIAGAVFSIKGAMAASKGERYRYPVVLRLVK